MATARTPRRKSPVREAKRALATLEHSGTRLLARAEKNAARYLSSGQRRAIRDLGKHVKGMQADIAALFRYSGEAVEKRAERALARVDGRAVRTLRKKLEGLRPVRETDFRRVQVRLRKVERRVEAIAGIVEQLEQSGSQPAQRIRAVQ
jgi:hypothetical protein